MGRNKREERIKQNKKKHNLTAHHIWPRSRDGTDDEGNILHKSPTIHNAWHTMFANLLVGEVIVLIKYCWTDENGNLKNDILGKHNLLTWKIVFGNASPAQAIEIIKKEWM